jgi:hypothetical protein
LGRQDRKAAGGPEIIPSLHIYPADFTRISLGRRLNYASETIKEK